MKFIKVTPLIIAFTTIILLSPLNCYAFEGNTHGFIASQALMLFENQYPSCIEEFLQYSGTIGRWSVEADLWNYTEITETWIETILAAKDHFWDADNGLPFCELGICFNTAKEKAEFL